MSKLEDLHSTIDRSWGGVEWGKFRNAGDRPTSAKEKVTFMEIPILCKVPEGWYEIGKTVVQFNPIEAWKYDMTLKRSIPVITWEIEDQELTGDNVKIFFDFLRKNDYKRDQEVAEAWLGDGI